MSDETESPSSSGDGEPPREGGSSGGAPPSRSRWLIPVILLLIVLIVAAAIVWWFFMRDNRPDVWEEATVPYTEDACEEEGNCELHVRALGGHGSHTGEGLFEFYYDPDIDDPIAQWGDCLDSVFTCINVAMEAGAETGDEPDRVALINGCVAEAACPGECKDRFTSRARGRDFEGLEALFFEMFVDERGYCVPREADQ